MDLLSRDTRRSTAGARQHRRDAAIVRGRARAVCIARDESIAVALAAGALSRTTLWRWICAYERDSVAALVPGRRGPPRPALKQPAWVEQVVIVVRLHTFWNAKRIAAELGRREIAAVSHCWVSQLFDDLGAHRPSGPRARGPRHERSSPNSLWHVDIKSSSSSARAGGT
jgi:transposase